MTHPIIIIGTGFAGYQLAREFRKLDTKTPLILITADAGHYYSKPQLSTAFTRNKTPETLAEATAEKMAEELNAIMLTHVTVTDIHPVKKILSVDKKNYPWSQLVLACGAETFKPELKGDGAADVLSVNHLYHYTQFRDLIAGKKKIAILGAGLIGCEFANDLANAGYHVDVISPANTPLDLLLPEEIGKILQTALENSGIHFHFDCTAKNIKKQPDKNNKIHYEITLSDNSIINTEFVLSAIGLKPHTTLAASTGIVINRGIVVNRYLETSVPDIYALGDCAEVEGHVLPYIAPIRNAARALALTLSGTRTPAEYPAMPVSVKTPAHPVVICPPPKGMQGKWEIEILEDGVRALFYSNEKKLHGFVLTDKRVIERATLVQEIPGLF